MRARTIAGLIFILFWLLIIGAQVYQDWLYTQYDWSKLP